MKNRNKMCVMCLVIAVCCAGIVGFCVGQDVVEEQQKDEEFAEETARVMEFKNAYIECEESVHEYVNHSRSLVCLQDMIAFTEESMRDHEREMYLEDELQTCEDALARLYRETEVCRVAETLKVKDGTH